MTVTSLLVLFGAVVAVVGIALASYHWSLRVYAGLRRIASENDLAMQRAGAALGLAFVPSVSYEHPIVGRIAGFGSLRGSIDGVQIRVEVRSGEETSGPADFWTELCAERIGDASRSAPTVIVEQERAYRIQRSGPTLIMRPTVPATGSSQAYLYRIVTDASVLARLVTELVALARSPV